jgi:hypothetical protein
MAQLPVEQVAVALARVQAVPQAPQSVRLVSDVSQPLGALLSQLPYPDEQVGTQAPLVQAVLPCALVQAVPQAPQLLASVLILVSQPLLALLSQLP